MPKMVADTIDSGITLAGGGALLRNIYGLIVKLLKLT